MSKPIIKVENISKQYRIGAREESYGTLRESIAGAMKAPFQQLRRIGSDPDEDSIWALKNINFEVQQGEVVGVIGRNGAGKSTLLKVLSRITEPTSGRIELYGRVASLLEVGTGFHPELSGRENIFLNGAILGMGRQEIMRNFDEIVDFAQVEKFIDTPVKRYSSGMYLRLAFAVAAHLNPEIMIVDEVLAVGDAEFQKKCLGKMQDVSQQEGKTILFVSHNMAAVQSLCKTAIYLQPGHIMTVGNVDEQIESYAKATRNGPTEYQGDREIAPNLLLEKISLYPNPVIAGESCELTLALTSDQKVCVMDLCVIFYSASGARVAILDLRKFSSRFYVEKDKPLNLKILIKSLPFVEGDYSMGLYVSTENFSGNIMDLTSMTVSNPGENGHIPYPVAYRGMIELDYML